MTRRRYRDAAARLTTDLSGAAPVQQFTPDQVYFRNTLGGGRWQADSQMGAFAPAHSITVADDGTCDVVRLDADGDSWIDLGFTMPPDVMAGRC